MQKYTLTVLINEKVSETDRNAIFESIKKDLGSLTDEDIWGVRSLAYEIKHNNKAFYAHFEFEAEPDAVIALDKNIRLNEDIIRYLIIRAKVKREKSKIKKEVKEKAETEGKIEEKEEIQVKTKKAKTK